eukprot:TRINITY_DN20912_c0_g1_i3.p1 TRINITY_DN20912_c0_g1~~TRINITY_DN20912_c0_g1_i3.p1  ORF type:complete len:167 (-),score=43.95 TRINITY_DN20912_c0_g1_i3:37-537(-)
MLRSLVGSEMCIRDSSATWAAVWALTLTLGLTIGLTLTLIQAAVWAVCPVEEANQDQVVLVSGSCDNTVKLWDTTQCAGTLHGHTGYVTAICVHQHTICSASFDKTVRVWDLQQRCLLVLRDHSDSVMCLCCWEEDGGLMLMSGSCDNTAPLRMEYPRNTHHDDRP